MTKAQLEQQLQETQVALKKAEVERDIAVQLKDRAMGELRDLDKKNKRLKTVLKDLLEDHDEESEEEE